MHSRLFLCSLLAACRIGYEPLPFTEGDGGPDGGVRDGGGADGHTPGADAAMGLDGGPPPDGCISMPAELCNRVDDDCDGAIDETWTVVSSFAECSGPAREDDFTLVGLSWNQADTIRSARVASGMLDVIAVALVPDLRAGMDTRRAVGNLLGYDMPMEFVFVPFPEAGNDPAIEPNLTRVELELAWGAFVVADGDGDDVVVYETGDPIDEPEAYAVAFRDARTGAWSDFRYEHFDAFDATTELFATAFDLADFGVTVADRMQVANVFNTEAAVGEDRVTEADGQGVVIRGGEPGWDAASALLMPAGAPFPTTLLDSDLVWIVALHPNVEPRCCPP